MYYNKLFNFNKSIRISILGANGGFGYSLLAQCKMIDKLSVSVVCDINVDATKKTLENLGWDTNNLLICSNLNEVEQIISRNGTAIISNPHLLPNCPVDMLIESTGNPELGAEIAERALINRQHVGMVSKETESVVGPYLADLAKKNGVVYTTIDGDQPSNLIHLYTWIENLGLEIIVAGKSSEYDYIWNSEKKSIQYLENEIVIPDFSNYWSISNDLDNTLKNKSILLKSLPQYATPDYCEMNVVANSLHLSIDKPELHYPICRITELADVFIPKEDGGILGHTGIVDVFNCLRRNDELSFAGGEFVIVKCHNAIVWDILKEKGHIVSKNNKYAAIILPYHLMGVESPISIFSAVLHNRTSGNPDQTQSTIMVGMAERNFFKGETLNMGGHHHIIPDVRPLLFNSKSESKIYVPFYLMSNKTLIRDVSKGAIFTLDDFDFSNSKLYEMYLKII